MTTIKVWIDNKIDREEDWNIDDLADEFLRDYYPTLKTGGRLERSLRWWLAMEKRAVWEDETAFGVLMERILHRRSS